MRGHAPYNSGTNTNANELLLRQVQFAQNRPTESSLNEADLLEPDTPDQFNKVQTFIGVREFEDTPQLIDTFV